MDVTNSFFPPQNPYISVMFLNNDFCPKKCTCERKIYETTKKCKVNFSSKRQFKVIQVYKYFCDTANSSLQS